MMCECLHGSYLLHTSLLVVKEVRGLLSGIAWQPLIIDGGAETIEPLGPDTW